MKPDKDLRHTLKRQYKESPRVAGVFAVRNKANGKVFLGSTLNIHGSLNRHEFTLTLGSHTNKPLQADWNQFGPDAFVFEILDTVRPKEGEVINLEAELEVLEELWIETLSPFGEKGYNTNRRIRQA